MTHDPAIDGVLIQWGERLFYPANRRVKSHTPRLSSTAGWADHIRSRLEATVRRAPQVMVKVTGGGRGMGAIAAHFRYISKNGRLDIEDDRGVVERGKDALAEIERQWQFGGACIDAVSPRREAFNVMLSMPRGTDPLIVQRAAREFAKIEFADHRYVMVLHDHQANPHVHLSVKAQSRHGQRLNPRKADLQRWRETFAYRLREWGVDAEATRQATRGQQRSYPTLKRIKAQEKGAPSATTATMRKPAGERFMRSHRLALESWVRIMAALSQSAAPADRELASGIKQYINEMPFALDFHRSMQQQRPSPQRDLPGMRTVAMPTIELSRSAPDIER